MTSPWFAAAIAAVLLVPASATTLFAGVVMAETSIASGPNGETSSQHGIVYVQGNKQKVETQEVATITDLDKNVIYIIDKHERAYTELPLPALTASKAAGPQEKQIQLNKTAETRVVADHPCYEYRATEANKLEHVTISACVSTSAPGAKEVSEFERKMVARLRGQKSERTPDSRAVGLMLEKQSVVRLRLPDPALHKAYRTALVVAETRVNDIQLKRLAAATFEPPKGFSKLQNQPRRRVPPASPNALDQTIDVIAPTLPCDARASRL